MNKHTHTIVCTPCWNLAEGEEDQRKQPRLWLSKGLPCKLSFWIQLLDRLRQRAVGLLCTREANLQWEALRCLLFALPGTHIWERITTVSSWNATAVASPISRPRKTAAKKVATHITCNEEMGGSYKDVRDLGLWGQGEAAIEIWWPLDLVQAAHLPLGRHLKIPSIFFL